MITQIISEVSLKYIFVKSPRTNLLQKVKYVITTPDSKVHGAYMGPTWGRQDPGGPHVGLMELATRDHVSNQYYHERIQSKKSILMIYALDMMYLLAAIFFAVRWYFMGTIYALDMIILRVAI